MDEQLGLALGAIASKLDGLERQRMAADEIEDRINACEAGMARALRRGVAAAAILSAVIAAAVNVAFHYFWR